MSRKQGAQRVPQFRDAEEALRLHTSSEEVLLDTTSHGAIRVARHGSAYLRG
ncbi:hypothetical protein [Shimazuella kribbensis]|uniref:hypothetical protein n=1 Tax=Shimazuella kribbensis TaxID=139808 RepID=UPI001470ADF3|nr:hypothetical protein [Shimazuella kribbensis]